MKSLKGLLIALTGVLVATSLVNIGNSGIPFFWVVFLLPFIELISGARLFVQPRSTKYYFLPILFVGIVAAALVLTAGVQMGMDLVPMSSEAFHLVSRLSVLAYFVVVLTNLDEKTTTQVILWLRRLLIAACLYGAYQLPAKLIGFPLAFDWLRNNRTFMMYQFGAAGWIGLVRATSIYAEPSQAAVPIVLLFILNIEVRARKFSKVFGWSVLILFSLLTFSRTVWLALFAAAVIFALFHWRAIYTRVQRHRMLALAVTILILVTLPSWAFLKMRSNADLSRQERSGSIVMGAAMVKGSPWIGYGWNSFKSTESEYLSIPVPGAEVPFETIHDTVIDYMQQAGIAGLLLAILPFALIILRSRSLPWTTYSTVAAFLVVAEFGGDIGYMSLVWLWTAVLISVRSRQPQQEILSAGRARIHRGTSGLSQPQHVAS